VLLLPLLEPLLELLWVEGGCAEVPDVLRLPFLMVEEEGVVEGVEEVCPMAERASSCGGAVLLVLRASARVQRIKDRREK
jgi:hypothetical protein